MGLLLLGSGDKTLPPRTGRILQTFPGQQANSWTEALVLAKHTVAGVDYLLVGGTCDYSGVYTGGGGSFTGVQFDWVVSRYLLSTGEPDLTFGTYGTWRINQGGNDNELGGILIDFNNRIVLSGIAWDSNAVSQTFKMVRLQADGTLDLNLGVYGYGSYYVNENGRYQCSNLTEQSNLKIISYTDRFTGGAHSTRVGRHHHNGAFDTSFGKSTPPTNQGFLEVEPLLQDTEGSNYEGHILVDASDKLYVSGRYDVSGASHYEGFVCRILADGSATDNTFGAQVGATGVWMKLIDFSLGMGNLNGIAFTATGGILATGSCKRDASEHQACAVVLLDSSGNLDTTFNPGGATPGVLETHLGSLASDYLFQPAVTPTGAFRFFGMTGSGNQDIANTTSPTAHTLSVGLLANGQLDTTWNGTGVFEATTTTLSTHFNYLILPDATVVVCGHTNYPSTNIAQALVGRLQSFAVDLVDSAFGGLVTPTAAPTAPTATTGASSAVTATTATLAGTVNPAGSNATCHFEYGLDANYLNKTAEVACGAGSSNVAVSTNLAGLLPGKTYHWRLVAYNGSVGLGSDANFTTGAGTLTVVSDSMTDADGTTFRNHTGKAEIDYTGSAYKESWGRGIISGNKAVFNSDPDHADPNKRWLWQKDSGLTNLTVSGIVTWNGNNDGNNRPTGVICRCQPLGEFSGAEDKFYYAGWKKGSPDVFVLGYLIGGILTDMDSINFSVVQGVANTITLTLNSHTATATITGGSRSLTGDTTTPDATLGAFTYVGGYFNRGLGDSIYNFIVTTP